MHHAGTDTIDTYRAFMDIMMHIKKKKMQMSMQGLAQAGKNAQLMLRQQIVASLLTKDDKDKYKNWQIHYSIIAEREYYLNTQTKAKQVRRAIHCFCTCACSCVCVLTRIDPA